MIFFPLCYVYDFCLFTEFNPGDIFSDFAVICFKFLLILFQIISLESILELTADSHDRLRQIDRLKSLAFSVFMQCRRILVHHAAVKSLTGFGPASVFDTFLKPKEVSFYLK